MKKIVIVLLPVLMVMSLAGCGSEKEENSKEEETEIKDKEETKDSGFETVEVPSDSKLKLLADEYVVVVNAYEDFYEKYGELTEDELLAHQDELAQCIEDYQKVAEEIGSLEFTVFSEAEIEYATEVMEEADARFNEAIEKYYSANAQ